MTGLTAARPRRFDRNLIVVGAGTAGLVAAAVAAKAGAAVTLVESGEMGGDCLNTGCVPSKALIHAARLVAQARRGEAMGLLGPAGPVDSAAAMRHVHAAIAAIAPHDSAARFRGMGVDVRHAHGSIVSPWAVRVGAEVLTARAIIVATGSEPVLPELPGLEAAGYLTTATLWRLERAPARLLILGGGPVACELSQAFARLGSQVTVVQRGPRLLEREDDDVAALVRAALERDGVRVLTGAEALHAERRDGQSSLRVAHAGGEHDLPYDALLLAVGRRARTRGFGLEALGIAAGPAGTLATDAFLRTRHPSLYACGDVAGPLHFTHAAAHQGWHAAINALFGSPLYRVRPGGAVMPWVTYTEPEIGRAGLNESAARRQGIAVEVTTRSLRELDRAIVDDAREGFVKVLTPPGQDRILGVTVAAPRAGEMLAEMVLAMRAGVGLKRLFGTIHAYPTYAEANRDVAADWRLRHAPGWLLDRLGPYHRWMRGAGGRR